MMWCYLLFFRIQSVAIMCSFLHSVMALLLPMITLNDILACDNTREIQVLSDEGREHL